MVQLCLGSANFGSKYGFDNKKIDTKKLSNILNLAFKSKLFSVDSSFEYLKSHHNLKKVIKKKMTINSKIFLKKRSNFTSVKKKIENFNKNSPSKIYSLLLHDQKEASNIKKIKLLKKLKEERVISKIGVSVYDYSILKKILEIWEPDIIQVPINPFNLDFISSTFLKSIKRKKILIFARSIFLQGLLIKKSNILDKKFKNDLNDWFNFCKSKSINPVKACLDFCKSIKEIDFLIVGVQNTKELKQIIKFFKQPKKINSNLIIKKKYKKIDLRKI